MLTTTSRLLVALAVVIVAGGCVARTAGPGAPRPSPTEAPSRERVVWANSLCSTMIQLKAEQSTGHGLATGPASETTDPDVLHYLSMIASSVANIVGQLDRLPETGIAEADRYVDGIAADLGDLEPELLDLVYFVSTLSPAERLSRVKQVADLIGSVQVDGLPKLVRKNPEVAAAYELAPNCEPVTATSSAPLPEAEDGTDLSACADGSCEVRLSGTTSVKVSDFQFAVTVAGGSVTVVHEFGGGAATLSPAESEVRFGTNDQIMTVTLSGIDGDTAVIKFTKE